MKIGLDAFIAFVVYRSDVQIVLRTLKTLCKALHNFFRISKGNLEMRPMFHFTERRIEAHVCICFIAYKIYKELQRLLPSYGIHMSVDKVLKIAKTIPTVYVKLPNGKIINKTLFLTDEQGQIKPLFDM